MWDRVQRRPSERKLPAAHPSLGCGGPRPPHLVAPAVDLRQVEVVDENEHPAARRGAVRGAGDLLQEGLQRALEEEGGGGTGEVDALQERGSFVHAGAVLGLQHFILV